MTTENIWCLNCTSADAYLIVHKLCVSTIIYIHIVYESYMLKASIFALRHFLKQFLKSYLKKINDVKNELIDKTLTVEGKVSES